MVFPGREGPKELGGKREREELWDLQEDRESKASREILALKESREKKVNNKTMMIIIIMIMKKFQVIFVIRDFAHDGSVGVVKICCGVTRKRLASPGHFDHYDDEYRCR